MVTSATDTPEWILFDTANNFTLTPSSPLCVQKSLTINKITSQATEHGKFLKALNNFRDPICSSGTDPKLENHLRSTRRSVNSKRETSCRNTRAVRSLQSGASL